MKNPRDEFKERLRQLTELSKSAEMEKGHAELNLEFKLFPDVKTILDYIEKEKHSTISAISKQFKMHPMTASDIVKRMKSQGLISIEQIGSAKFVKRATE